MTNLWECVSTLTAQGRLIRQRLTVRGLTSFFRHTVTSRVEGRQAIIKKLTAVSTGDLATVHNWLSMACKNQKSPISQRFAFERSTYKSYVVELLVICFTEKINHAMNKVTKQSRVEVTWKLFNLTLILNGYWHLSPKKQLCGNMLHLQTLVHVDTTKFWAYDRSAKI